MKIKALLVMGFFMMGLMFMAPQTSEAQERFWTNGTIDRFNQTTSHIGIAILFDGEEETIGLRVYEDNPKYNQILAILLTAWSLDKRVRLNWSDGSPGTVWAAGLQTD